MEEQTDYNLRIAREIWSVLRTAPSIIMSWGLDPDTVKPIEYGIQFHVQGFKHTGQVQIKLNEGADLYDIFLLDNSGEQLIESYTDIYVDQLLDTIDRAVEYTADYEKRVDEAYPGLSGVRTIVIV